MYYIHLHRQCNLIQAPLDPLKYGWRKRDDKMEHIEDSKENIGERNTYLRKLKKKCGCKKSMCLTTCGCKVAGEYCSRLCKRRNCKNTADQAKQVGQDDQVESRIEQNADLLSSSDESSSDSEPEELSESEEQSESEELGESEGLEELP